MNVTSKLFNTLTVLVALTLCVTLTGCGNSDSAGSGGTAGTPKDSKQAMSDAANELFAAVRNLSESVGTTASAARGALDAFKKQTNAISLAGCSQEFSNAFAAVTKTLSELTEFKIKVIEGKVMEGGTEHSSSYERFGEAMMQFQELCKKLGLDVQFD